MDRTLDGLSTLFKFSKTELNCTHLGTFIWPPGPAWWELSQPAPLGLALLVCALSLPSSCILWSLMFSWWQLLDVFCPPSQIDPGPPPQALSLRFPQPSLPPPGITTTPSGMVGFAPCAVASGPQGLCVQEKH